MVRTDDWTRAQASLVGSALIDPACVPVVMSAVRAEDLSGEYRTLWEAIVDLRIRGQAVDPVTVLASVGPAYTDLVRTVMRETVTAANVAAYAEVCREQSRLSRLAELGVQLSGAPTLAEARETLQRAEAVAVEQNAVRITDMTAALQGFFDVHGDGREKEYIGTGIPELDEKLTLDLGDVLVLGGYPSAGKTALMLQWCWQMAGRFPVGVFSFETGADKLADRLVTQAVPELRFGDVKHNTMTREQWNAVAAASTHITRRPVELIEAAGMTTSDVLGVTLSRGYKVIALDYVQLVQPGAVRKGGTRAEELAEISKALALMARRHKLLVIELSQLVRPQRTKDGRTPAPTMSSLRESGQLEQDADVIALLYRTSDTGDGRELYVAKNKEGLTGKVSLVFNGQAQRFAYVAHGDAALRMLENEARKRRARDSERPTPEQTQIEEVKG